MSSLADVAGYIANRLGVSLNCVAYDRSEDTRMQSDSTRAANVLGWEPRVSLEEGLDATLAGTIAESPS